MRITDRPLFYWVFSRYRGLQLILLLVIVVSLFFRVYPLEMQRKIINEAINLRMIDKLFLYCALYMGAVLAAGLLKYLINTMQAIIGQKILIDMRRELYRHILQLPLPFFHRTQTGTVISAMTAELNAIATFLGGAIAVPVTSVLTFVAFLAFMIYLNPLLGLLSAIIYPLEASVIPLLQNWYNKYNHKRVATTRAMASLVNESVSGIHEVQGNASYLLEEHKLERLAKRLYRIMFKLSIFKYGIKFSNNLFQSIGPFLLFLVGGYMAINGNFTIGALVAFLSAYEKVYDPWKEVIEYYQVYQDARVRYRQIMRLFEGDPVFRLEAPERRPLQLQGRIEAEGLDYRVNESVQLLSDISFSLEPGRHLALIGFSGSGKSTLSLLISQLYKPSSGSLAIDGQNIEELSKLEIALNISSVAQHPFIFTGTVRENLLYASNTLVLNQLREATPDSQEIIDMVREVGLAEDVIRWGLRSVIDPRRAEPMIPSFLRMRQVIREQLGDTFSRAIEFYHLDRYLQYSTVATNLIFGSYGSTYATERFLKHSEFREFLRKVGLERKLIELGAQIGAATIEFLGDFRGDDFFFQGSPMNPGQFERYEKLLLKAGGNPFARLKPAELDQLLFLALDFTAGVHKIYTISNSLQEEILTARQQFLETIGGVDLDQCSNSTIQTEIIPYRDQEETADTRLEGYTPFCINQYLLSQSLMDNILFGTIVDHDAIRGPLATIAMKEFERLGLLNDIMEIGLDFHVGSKGDNLSGGQKQKIALARAFLKHSPILILDEATASLDNSSQAKIQHYISTRLRGNTTVVAVVHRLDMISGYDHIIVMKDGKIIESGSYNNLVERRGILYELINQD